MDIDKIGIYLMEADMHLDSIIEVSFSDQFFESEAQNKEVSEQNEKHTFKALESIKKVFSELIKKLKELAKRVHDWITMAFLSKTDRERYKEFQALLKEHPELRNAEVSGFSSFEEYKKLYDRAINELQKEANKEEPSMEFANKIQEMLGIDLQKLAEKTGSKVKDMSVKAGMKITINTAIEIANRDANVAKLLKKAIDDEIISLESIEKELGKAQAAKFERKIKRYAKSGKIHHMINKLLHKEQETLVDVMQKQMNKLLSFTNLTNGKLNEEGIVSTKSVITGIAKNHDVVVASLGGKKETLKAVKTISKTGAKVAYARHKSKVRAKKNKRDLKQSLSFFGLSK